MPSDTEIANIAISHLGTGKDIANLTTGSSQEAKVMRRFFEAARDKVLGDFPWPFATKFVALGLIASNPTDEWAFSYGYPSDAVRLNRIRSGVRNDSLQSRVPYKIVHGASAREIYTDQEDAEAEFTFCVTDTGRFPMDFVMAFSYYLAELAAPRLTAGDPFKLQERMDQFYQREITNAWANAANEEKPDERVDSEFVRVRG